MSKFSWGDILSTWLISLLLGGIIYLIIIFIQLIFLLSGSFAGIVALIVIFVTAFLFAMSVWEMRKVVKSQ